MGKLIDKVRDILKEYYDSADMNILPHEEVEDMVKNPSMKNIMIKDKDVASIYNDSKKENTLNLGDTINNIILKYSPLLNYYKYTFTKNTNHKFIELNYELINKKNKDIVFKSHVNVIFFYKDMKKSGEFAIDTYFDIQKITNFSSSEFKINNPEYDAPEVDDKMNYDIKSDEKDDLFFNEIAVHEKVKNFDLKKFEEIIRNDVNKSIIQFDEYCVEKYNISPLN